MGLSSLTTTLVLLPELHQYKKNLGWPCTIFHWPDGAQVSFA
jgi:hypothetical protein